MSTAAHWVGKISVHDLNSLALYRNLAGWSLAPDSNESYWIKVPSSDEASFRKLPLLGRWIAAADGKLTREGKRVAEATLPTSGWQSVASLLPIGVPRRGAPGMPTQAIHFQLLPDDAGAPAIGMLCQSEDFAAWASQAFSARIECLRFACCENLRTFVMGNPLPPLPGLGFILLGRLLIPCGWRLPDHVWPELLEEILGLGSNRMCILHPDGSYEELDEGNLILANRSAIRSSNIA